MADPINDIFGKTDGLDPFGPYSRDEYKVEDVSGNKIATRQIHLEQNAPDGTRNIFSQTQHLCNDCGGTYVTIGQTGSIVDNKILCGRCVFKSRIIKFIKFSARPFITITDSK